MLLFRLYKLIIFLLIGSMFTQVVPTTSTLESGDLADIFHRQLAVNSYDTLTKYLETYQQIKSQCQKLQELQNRFSITTGKVFEINVPLPLAPNLKDYLKLNKQTHFTYVKPNDIGDKIHVIRHPFLTKSDLKKKENFFKYLDSFYHLTERIIWTAEAREKEGYINHTQVHLLLMQQTTLAETLRQMAEEINRYTKNFNSTQKK